MLAHRIPQKIAVSVVYVSAMFMAIMDITIVNVTLPRLASDFGVAPDRIDGVVVGFLVSLAIFIPASGWLGDRFGMKRMLLLAIVIFTGASALCGMAQSLTQLVIFRILQGVGGGMLTPIGMALLFRTFPPAERVRASRLLIVPTAFAPALGPVLGGFLVTDVSWRWVFFVNLPIGLAALTFGFLFLKEHKEPAAGRFDLGGFLLAGIGLPALMYSLSEGPSRGWTSPLIVGVGVVGVVLLAVLVRYELRVGDPMIDLRLVGNRLFRSSTMIIFIGMAAFLGTLYAVALFFQAGLGLTALNAGLSTFPEAIGVMIGAQISTRLYPSIGPRRLIATGLVCVALLALSMTLVGFATSLWVPRILMFFLGISIAHVFTPTQAAAFATISLPSTGRASTLFNTSRQLGSAVGVAILTTVISAVGVTHRVRAAGHHPHAGSVIRANLAAFHWAFAVAAGLALVAARFALTVVDADAAPTMVKRPGERALAREQEVELVPSAG